MITVEGLLVRLPDLQFADLDRWIENDWVRPDGPAGDYVFGEIDVARVRLIHDLTDRLKVDEAALPVVLLLLDQLYDLRRRLRLLYPEP